jgi:outer membrane protein assembly factor BamB
MAGLQVGSLELKKLRAAQETVPKWMNMRWLRPKRILASFVVSLFLGAGYYGIQYCKGFPVPLWYIRWVTSKSLVFGKDIQGPRIYPNSNQVTNQIEARPPGQVGARVDGDKSIHNYSKLRQAWKVRLPKGVFGAVTLSGNSVFVGCDDGNTYELNQSNGEILRRFYTGTEVTPAPLVWNSRLFIGEGMHTSHHSRIYSFDLQTGEFLGAFETLGHTEGEPFIATFSGVTSMFVVAGRDGVYSIDPMTMQQRWHRTIGHIDAEVRVAGSLVFVGTGVEKGYRLRSHQAFALDFISGEDQWRAELAESSWMPPVLMGHEVCFGTGEIYSVSHFGQLACFEQLSGKASHTLSTPAPLLGVPLQLGEILVTSDLEGQVCAFQWPSAIQLWCRKTVGNKTFASVSYDAGHAGEGGLVYPTSQDGILVLDEKTGKTLKNWLPQKPEGAWRKSFSRVVMSPQGWFISDSLGQIRKLTNS